MNLRGVLSGFKHGAWKIMNITLSCPAKRAPVTSTLYQLSTRYSSSHPNPDRFVESAFSRKVSNIRLALGMLRKRKDYYRERSHILYETIDDVDTNKFMKVFQLEDTFSAWFRVAELHIWILLVRGRSEDKEGIFLNKCLLECMWVDMKRRAQLVDKTTSLSVINDALMEYHKEMIPAFLGYDEGIQSSDMVLANALWKRFFAKNCNEPELLEKLLEYVRRQVKHFDDITREDFLERPNVTWLPLDNKR